MLIPFIQIQSIIQNLINSSFHIQQHHNHAIISHFLLVLKHLCYVADKEGWVGQGNSSIYRAVTCFDVCFGYNFMFA